MGGDRAGREADAAGCDLSPCALEAGCADHSGGESLAGRSEPASGLAPQPGSPVFGRLNGIIDALDRVTAITYPDVSLNTTYTYDDPLVSFSKGRITQIAKPDSVINYRYDRFGRTLQDGELAYTWDATGNPASNVYPGSVTAVYGSDVAD